MPCGKKPLVKKWDHPKNIKVVKPSRYQQNEASVKVYWEAVIKDLEMSYKDEQFWETQTDIVRDLVGPVIFERIAKIFNLPIEATPYKPTSEVSSVQPSEQFYVTARKDSLVATSEVRREYSMSDYEPSVQEDEEYNDDEDESAWTASTTDDDDLSVKKSSRSFSNKKMSGTLSSKSFSKVFSKLFSTSKGGHSKSQNVIKSLSSKVMNKSKTFMSETVIEDDDSPRTNDDLDVHPMSLNKRTHRRVINPHFDMLYCNDSESDMIKWNSKYKQKTFEVSASDEFSKKAEILTKQIAYEFFEWWTGLGNVEFRSEIKRPEDIEELFQVWFDEHASRGIKFDPKILPCVLPHIAYFVGVPEASCPHLLKKQIASDIHAETSPAHTMAFGTYLPLKMKHIPPQNNTKEIWHCLKIPQDLRSMAAVWDDIQHLTSTKAFQKWLEQRPHLPMPPCFTEDGGEKKQPFVVPSDVVLRHRSMDEFSTQDLAMPISQFSIEIKEVLSKLLND